MTDLKSIIMHWPRFRISAAASAVLKSRGLLCSVSGWASCRQMWSYVNGEHSAPPLSLSHSFAISHKSECRPLSVCSCTECIVGLETNAYNWHAGLLKPAEECIANSERFGIHSLCLTISKTPDLNFQKVQTQTDGVIFSIITHLVMS